MQQIMASIITFLYKKDCRDKKTFQIGDQSGKI